ncbi:TauD/TfdA dioxygenase family protein [Novosphingobium resinovorum]|nr:TauD/TfdA family dioxygenase [Novosphingobium resinovorum]
MRHPESGRKMLHISPLFAQHILGLEAAASNDLLGQLIDHITDDSLAYYHDWKNDELVLWDNFRTIHSAEGVPQGESREMHRTTISATYELGRYLGPQAA